MWPKGAIRGPVGTDWVSKEIERIMLRLLLPNVVFDVLPICSKYMDTRLRGVPGRTLFMASLCGIVRVQSKIFCFRIRLFGFLQGLFDPENM